VTPSDSSPPDSGHNFFKAGIVHPFFCGIWADTHGLGGLLLSDSWIFGNQINKITVVTPFICFTIPTPDSCLPF
jgi:hypothetical protein